MFYLKGLVSIVSKNDKGTPRISFTVFVDVHFTITVKKNYASLIYVYTAQTSRMKNEKLRSKILENFRKRTII